MIACDNRTQQTARIGPVMVNRITKKNFMASFHGWGSIASWLVEPLRGGCLLFPTRFLEIPDSWYSFY